MALVLANRVKETTTTTGQGTVTLDGASVGYQSFAAIGDGNTTYYTIAGQGTSEWEVGIGTYTSSGTTLSRDTVLASSAGAPTKTTFTAGTKDVFVTYPSDYAVTTPNTNTFTANQIVSVTDNTNAALRITQLGSGNALLVEDIANPDASPFVIDASGRVIAGYTSAIATTTASTAVTPNFEVIGTSLSASAGGIYRYSASSGAGRLVFSKSRTDTIGAQAAAILNDDVGVISYSASDGTQFIEAARITASVDGTPGTNDMPGRLVFSTTADGASSPTERMRINSDGAVGIGTTVLGPEYGLRVTKTLFDSTNGIGLKVDVTGTSTLTSALYGNSTTLVTASNGGVPYTLPNSIGYSVSQGTFNADSAVTTQYGYRAESSLIGAATNYGFWGNIPFAANRYNLYMAGTADNYMAGNVLLGSATSVSTAIDAARLQVIGTNNPTAQIAIGRFSNDVDRPRLSLYKSRSGTVGTNTIVQNNDAVGDVVFQGADGANYVVAAKISTEVDGTPGTNDMPGRLVFSTTADGASSPTERMRINSSGNVGIGGTAGADTKFQLLGTYPTSGTNTFVQQLSGTSPSGTTNVLSGYRARLNTEAAAFALSNLRIFDSGQGTIGATSSVTTQYGYWADASLTGATTNIGFYGNIASGANRFNLYMNGTADNYMAGSLGIGAVPPAGWSVVLGKTITGAASSYGFVQSSSVLSDVTNAFIFSSNTSTQATAFTLTGLHHFRAAQSTIGAGSSITNQYGFIVDANVTGATNNYGFYGNIAAPTTGITTTGTISTISSSGTTVTVSHNAITYTNGQTVTIAATANATALVSGATATILTVGTTDYTLIGAASNTVGLSFTATGAGTGTGTVRLNVQGSGKTVAGAASGSFTYTTTTSQTFAAVTVLAGTVTVSARYNLYMAGTAANYFNGDLTVYGSTAIPAGGTAGSGYKLSSTANFGVFFGSGAPTLSAARGSLYLRSDGTTTNNRMYVNTDGATTWTAVTTAA